MEELQGIADLSLLLENEAPHYCILDEAGHILYVNSAWKKFCADNGGNTNHNYVGTNYLQICGSGGSNEAVAFFEGIRRLQAGLTLEEFSLEYPCDSPSKARMFVARAYPFHLGENRYTIVSHELVSEQAIVKIEDPESRLHSLEVPEKPLPSDCCRGGCCPCVWDIYYDALEKYNVLKEQLEKQSAQEQGLKHVPLSIKMHDAVKDDVHHGQTHKLLKLTHDAHFESYKQLTTSASKKKVFHVELGFEENVSISFREGDSIAIFYRNDQTAVEIVRKALALTDNKSIPQYFFIEYTKPVSGIPFEEGKLYSLDEAIATAIDLHCVPSKTVIKMLTHFTNDERERNLLLQFTGNTAYDNYIIKRKITFAELLSKFPQCKPPLENLLYHLPRIKPRLYSIANSPHYDPTRIHIAFTQVQYRTKHLPPKDLKGICTNWMTSEIIESLPSRHLLKIYVEPGKNFDSSKFDHRKPLILIATGTGVAPFRAFLQTRRFLKSQYEKGLEGSFQPGPCWLFFGCRNSNEDYLYKEELEEMRHNGIITNLILAFSRENIQDVNSQSHKKEYVQHKLSEYGGDVVPLMVAQHGYCWMCGVQGLAAGVVDVLKEMLKTHGKMNDDDVASLLTSWVDSKHLAMELWS